jgi:hypothetical protein
VLWLQVQADDIKVYIAATLGEAPKPDWGLKNGWGQYLAGELVLCCAVLRCLMLCCAVLHCVVLCCAALCAAVVVHQFDLVTAAQIGCCWLLAAAHCCHVRLVVTSSLQIV